MALFFAGAVFRETFEPLPVCLPATLFTQIIYLSIVPCTDSPG